MPPRTKTFLLLLGSWVIGGLTVGLYGLSANAYYNLRGAVFSGLVYSVTWLIWVRLLKLGSRNQAIGLFISTAFPFVTWATTVVLYQMTFYAFYNWKISLFFGLLNYAFTLLLERLAKRSS
jgi:hypothetical protein